MQVYLWIALVVAAIIVIVVLLERSQRKAEIGLSPDQIRRKRRLEGQVDDLNL